MKQSAISGVTKVRSNIILPPDFVILDLGPRSGFRRSIGVDLGPSRHARVPDIDLVVSPPFGTPDAWE